MRIFARLAFYAVGLALLALATSSYAEDKPPAYIEFINNTQRPLKISVAYQKSKPPKAFVLAPGCFEKVVSTDPKPKFFISYNFADKPASSPGQLPVTKGQWHVGVFTDVSIDNDTTLYVRDLAIPD